MPSAPQVLDLLRRAEPCTAAGIYVHGLGDATDAAIVFAYERGGRWSLVSSEQGLRVSDGETLWSVHTGSTTVRPGPAGAYHSGQLRDMLMPRHRNLEGVTPGRRQRQLTLAPHVADVVVLGRPAHRVHVLGEDRFPDWQMDVDAATGITLANRFVQPDGTVSRQGFLALSLEEPLPDSLFTWPRG